MAENDTPTQVSNPWRATARTVFQMLVGLAALFTLISVDAGTPAAVASAVAVSAAVTKSMAVKEVNDYIQKYLPFLAAEGK